MQFCEFEQRNWIFKLEIELRTDQRAIRKAIPKNSGLAAVATFVWEN